MKNWQNHITINSEIRSGKPCIIGTRITVADILSLLASEMTIEEILLDYRELKPEHIYAALSFATHRENITQIAVA